MLRFVLLLATAFVLAGATIIGAISANAHFGFLPTETIAQKLDLLKLLPATMAVIASIFGAAVSVLLVGLQKDSARAIEGMKSGLQSEFELFRRRLDLAGGIAAKSQGTIDSVRLTASTYHAELKRLEAGHFSLAKIADVERSAEILGGTIPREAPYMESWFRFCQQGYCMSDVAKRKSTISERRSLWEDEGRLLGEQFEKLLEQLRLEEEQIRARALSPNNS